MSDLSQCIQQIEEAIKLITAGTCNRVDVTRDIKVYRVQNVIRIDYKLSNV